MSENHNSLRQLAKAIGVNHSTLVKIANGTYPANPKNIVNKLISALTGVMIPPERYDDILNMLKDSSFPKFGETSMTAAWLYEQIEIAQQKLERANEEE